MRITTILCKYALLQMYIIVTQKDDPDALASLNSHPHSSTLELKIVPQDKYGLYNNSLGTSKRSDSTHKRY